MNDLQLKKLPPPPVGSRHDVLVPDSVYADLKAHGLVLKRDPRAHGEQEPSHPAQGRGPAVHVRSRSRGGIEIPTIFAQPGVAIVTGHSPAATVRVYDLESFLAHMYGNSRYAAEIATDPVSESSGTITCPLSVGTQGGGSAGTSANAIARGIAYLLGGTNNNTKPGNGGLSITWVDKDKSDANFVMTNGTTLGSWANVAGTTIAAGLQYSERAGYLFALIHDHASTGKNRDMLRDAAIRSSGPATTGSLVARPQATVASVLTCTSSSGLSAKPSVINGSSEGWDEFEEELYRRFHA